MTQSVFIIDDHPLLREGLASVLDRAPGLSVVDEADSAEEALARIAKGRPDIVVVDVTLDGMNGLEFVKHLQATAPDVPVLVMSMHDEGLYAERALRAGARGYLEKRQAGSKVVNAIRQILSGGYYFSPTISARIFGRAQTSKRAAPSASPLETLTDRELELFEAYGRGLTTGQVAEALSLSPKTVGTHRDRIRKKLGLGSGAEMVQHAVLWVRDLVVPS